MTVTIDPNVCSSLDDGMPLESRSVEPTLYVDYEPSDLAAGRDTVLERAVSAIRRR